MSDYLPTDMLSIDELFYTKMEKDITLAQIFPPDYTFFFKLYDYSWIQYQLKNREKLQSVTLLGLMEQTFGKVYPYHYFRYERITKLPNKFITMIKDIHRNKDNFRLTNDLYYYEPFTHEL